MTAERRYRMFLDGIARNGRRLRTALKSGLTEFSDRLGIRLRGGMFHGL